ncbi:hypothetical protein Tco_0582842 [Tanacetum coccineum]
MKFEFMALAAAGNEAEWLRNLVYKIPLWPKPMSTISIRCDSVATLAKAYNQVYNVKSRHLGVRHSMIRELIMNGVISVEFLRTQLNLADHLTKGLARDLVRKAAIGIGNLDIFGLEHIITSFHGARGACVQNVVDSMVPALLRDKNRTFTYESLYIASLLGRARTQMYKYFNDKGGGLYQGWMDVFRFRTLMCLGQWSWMGMERVCLVAEIGIAMGGFGDVMVAEVMSIALHDHEGDLSPVLLALGASVLPVSINAL